MSKDKISEHRRRITHSINTMEDALDVVRMRLDFLVDDMDYIDSLDLARMKMLRQDATDLLDKIDHITFEYKNMNPFDDEMND